LSIPFKIYTIFPWLWVPPIRQRYIVTKQNHIRLRFWVFIALICTIYLFLIFSTNKDYNHNTFSSQTAVAGIVDKRNSLELVSTPSPLLEKISFPQSSQENIFSGVDKVTTNIISPSFKNNRVITLKPGQTIAGVLQKEGITSSQAYYAIKALGKYFDPRKVQPEQEIILNVKQSKGEDTVLDLNEMRVKIDSLEHVSVRKNDTYQFNAELVKKSVHLKINTGFVKIQTSVYGSAAKAGLPSPITAEIIRIFSWDVDFQRDIRQGDEINVLYETYETENGELARYGNVLYVNLSVAGIHIPVYRFKMQNGDIDYFTENGWSVKKTLMKTPIDGARLSSGFGMRKHPILGYNKMHKGVDFAAATGTPIYAAGDGTVEVVGRRGSYGNYMRIRHNSQLKTAYAHMHKFAKKMAAGTRVKQGQIIGYVGNTGRSTGPHLHYEVIKNGVQVNPNRVDLPTGEKLKGSNLENLKLHISKIQKQYNNIRASQSLAQDKIAQKINSKN